MTLQGPDLALGELDVAPVNLGHHILSINARNNGTMDPRANQDVVAPQWTHTEC